MRLCLILPEIQFPESYVMPKDIAIDFMQSSLTFPASLSRITEMRVVGFFGFHERHDIIFLDFYQFFYLSKGVTLKSKFIIANYNHLKV